MNSHGSGSPRVTNPAVDGRLRCGHVWVWSHPGFKRREPWHLRRTGEQGRATREGEEGRETCMISCDDWGEQLQVDCGCCCVLLGVIPDLDHSNLLLSTGKAIDPRSYCIPSSPWIGWIFDTAILMPLVPQCRLVVLLSCCFPHLK